ncbi:MAG: alpha/beta hydrolase family protein [Planctomycetota bacterium]
MSVMVRCGWALACVLVAEQAWSSDISGSWVGAVVREGAIQQIELQITAQPDSKLGGTFSIPELGLYYEPLSGVAFQSPTLSFTCLYGRFDTTVHGDFGELVGVNAKWGPPVRIHLKKSTPVRRCSYEEIRFRNLDVELAGTIVWPVGRGPFPAAVVICGSSPEGRRDGEDAWGYRGWGEVLAERGVATLVYDKRGVGESGGKPQQWTLFNLADDALAGVQALRLRKEIDPARVGLVGLSQGGWVAPIAAAKDSAIAFMILQVPPAVSVAAQEIDAVAAALSSESAVEAGIRAADIVAAQEFEREMFEVAYGRKPWLEFERLAVAASKQPWAKFIDIPKTESDLEWWRRNEFDPATTLRSVHCPVLALFGEDDLLVPPAKNLPLLKKYLGEGGNKDVTTHVFRDVGHGCELPRRLIGDNWRWPESFWVWPRKAPGFYLRIAEWLQQHQLTD